ncbi:MAG: hypothetical protein ACD_71C00081G0001, partial [uncultured bacterium (gcode 4)]
MEFDITGLTNPTTPGKYQLFAKMVETFTPIDWAIEPPGTMFWWETFIRDLYDFTAPTIVGVYPQWPYKVAVEFSEPVFLSYDAPVQAFFTGATALPSYGIWNNPNSEKVLYISTDTQTGTLYSLTLSGAKDFNNNYLTGSSSFTGMTEFSPVIDYIIPNNLIQWKTNYIIDVYGKNNIFVSAATDMSFNFWSGITTVPLSIVKIDNNHVSLKVNVDIGATIGPRILNFTSSGPAYRLFEWGFVDKDWGNLATIDLFAKLIPKSNITSETTNYNFELPTNKLLSANDKIEIKFPTWFDISNALFDSGSTVNYLSGLIGWTPKFIVTKDVPNNKVTLTINDWYVLNTQDYIMASINGVVNPSYSGANFVADVTTKTQYDSTLETFKSFPIFIKDAPSGASAKTITFNFVDINWNPITGAGIENAVINLNGPLWYKEILVNNLWTASFVWYLNDYYNIFVDKFVKIKSGYEYAPSNYIYEGNFINTYLDGDKTINLVLKNVASADFMSVSWNVRWLSWEDVALWVSTMNGYFEKNLWILNSNDFAYTIKLPKNSGYTSIWIRQNIPKDFLSTTFSNFVQTWQPPRSQNIDVGIANISGVNFVVDKPNIDFTVNVVDNKWNAMPKAHIYVYSPSGNMMGLYGDTDMAGSKTFKVLPGTYTYGAYIEWLPAPAEKNITISSTTSGTLLVNLPDLTIEWKVQKSNGDPISNTSVYAYESNKMIWRNTMTDSNGKYKIYADNWNWKLGWYIPSYGPLDEQSITVNGVSLTNQNFTIDISNLHTVEWSVKLTDISGIGIAGVNIFAEPTDGDYSKWWFAFTDDMGGYSLLLKPGSYRLKAFSPEYWEVWSVALANLAGNVVWKNFFIAPPKSVTLSFTWDGVPSDLTNFEWIADIFDKQNNIWFSQSFKWQSSYVFRKVPTGTYSMKISVVGMGPVYSSGSFEVSDNKSVDIPLSSARTLLTLSWTIRDISGSAP